MINDSSKSAAERRERFQSQKHTQFAKVFLKSHQRSDHSLDNAIKKLNQQFTRACADTSRDQRKFIRQRNNQPEPTILVARPSLYKLMHSRSAEFSGSSSPPRYMQPLKSHFKPPSDLDTIDAFTVRPRRKTNIWEEYGPKLEPHFRSVVLPSNRLSQSEMKDLKLGYSFHKPRINTPQPTQPYQPTEPTQPNQPTLPMDAPINEKPRYVLPIKRDDFLITRMLEEKKNVSKQNEGRKKWDEALPENVNIQKKNELENPQYMDENDNVFVTQTKPQLNESKIHDQPISDIKVRLTSSAPKSKMK